MENRASLHGELPGYGLGRGGNCVANGVKQAFNSKTFNSFWPLSNILQTIYMMISAK